MSDIDVMLAILKVTKFENRSYNFDEKPYDPNERHYFRDKGYNDHNPELVKILADNGYSPRVYISIAPEIKLTRLEFPKGYNKKTLDIRELHMGDPNCKHLQLPLYWETGGGMMDSGDPHHYSMCMYCGYHPTKLKLGWFKKLIKGFTNAKSD